MSTWGAFKDSPYEGYHPLRQVRTVALAAVAALVVVASTATRAGGVAVVILPALGVVYTLERLATEWWKSIVRSDDQAAYTIPMRLGFRGRPIDATVVRWAVGLAVIAAMVVIGWLVHAAQQQAGEVPGWLVGLTVGGLGGWLTAIGGAWKDAPIEGFSGWKFLRSPLVATAWAVPLSLLTQDWVTLVLSAGGMAVASIETYKTFLTGGRPPGKFDGKPVRWVPTLLMRRIGRAHAGGWAIFGAIALLQAAQLLRGPHTLNDGHEDPSRLLPALVAGGVAVVCVCAVAVVLRASALFASAQDQVAEASERAATTCGVGEPVDVAI
ncbi:MULTISPECIES: hypothetical protein [unclassified Nocardioides]|uniref:hypothetical protein n=1 Tax=unclassified Nocardioides TaxID=2615069 RepID=UPI0000571956|nr:MULTISPECIES: hypothetical protein [unclassified Nocardioides]ABL81071.1 hypothetical protein Noca_1557 [Nocardioides sp. JS614]